MTHGDIKIENILLQEVSKNYFKVKLIDFGHSQIIGTNQKSIKPVGTLAYNPFDLNEDIKLLEKGKIN